MKILVTDSEDNKWVYSVSHLIESQCTNLQRALQAGTRNPAGEFPGNQAAAFASGSFSRACFQGPWLSLQSSESPLPFLLVDPMFSYDSWLLFVRLQQRHNFKAGRSLRKTSFNCVPSLYTELERWSNLFESSHSVRGRARINASPNMEIGVLSTGVFSHPSSGIPQMVIITSGSW